MKRDMDLMRKILFAVEESEDENIELDCLDDDLDRVYRHVELMHDGGLVVASIIRSADGPVEKIRLCQLKRLTWKGHDFLDRARDESIWKKAKRICVKKGKKITLAVFDSVLTDLIIKKLVE